MLSIMPVALVALVFFLLPCCELMPLRLNSASVPLCDAPCVLACQKGLRLREPTISRVPKHRSACSTKVSEPSALGRSIPTFPFPDSPRRHAQATAESGESQTESGVTEAGPTADTVR
eukprot:1967240-Pleurochrysis_carterae.AAC.1